MSQQGLNLEGCYQGNYQTIERIAYERGYYKKNVISLYI